MKFRPLHVRVLVKRLVAEDETSGGSFIPDTAKEKPLKDHIILGEDDVLGILEK